MYLFCFYFIYITLQNCIKSRNKIKKYDFNVADIIKPTPKYASIYKMNLFFKVKKNWRHFKTEIMCNLSCDFFFRLFLTTWWLNLLLIFLVFTKKKIWFYFFILKNAVRTFFVVDNPPPWISLKGRYFSVCCVCVKCLVKCPSSMSSHPPPKKKFDPIKYLNMESISKKQKYFPCFLVSTSDNFDEKINDKIFF